MRMLVSGLLAVGLLHSNVAAAQCVRSSDYPAFDITALQNKLMVTALTCDAHDKYDAFVMKYRPELVSQNKALGSYFSRAHGRRARQQQDDYMTQLSNSQSSTGLRQGTLYCQYNVGVFDEVMALRSSSELTDYAAGKSVMQPIAMSECGAVAAPATRPRARRHS